MTRLLSILALAIAATCALAAPNNVQLLVATNGAVVGPTNFWNANSNSVFGVLRSTLASKADTNNPTFNGLNIAGGNGLELTFPYGAFSIDATGKISGTVLQNGTVSSNAFDAPTLSMFGVSSGGTLSYDVAIYATTTSTNATAVYTNSIGTNVTHILSLNIVANSYEDYLVSRINCDSNGVVTVTTNSLNAIMSLGGTATNATVSQAGTGLTDSWDGLTNTLAVASTMATDVEVASATAPKQDTNSSLSSLISLTLKMPHIAGTLGSNIFLGSGSDVMEQRDANIHHASRNIVIGWDSLTNNRTGYYNWSIGWENLRSNLTGSGNVAIGGHALEQQTNGWDNIGIGDGAGQSNVTSSVGVFVGHLAGVSLRGSGTWGDTIGRNVFIGYEADVTPDGSIEWNLTNATAIGAQAKVTKSNQAVIGGPYNTEVLLNGSIVANAPGNNIRLVSNDGTDDTDGFVGAYSGGIALANWDFTRGLSIATNGVISGVGSSVLADGIIPSAITRDSELGNLAYSNASTARVSIATNTQSGVNIDEALASLNATVSAILVTNASTNLDLVVVTNVADAVSKANILPATNAVYAAMATKADTNAPTIFSPTVSGNVTGTTWDIEDSTGTITAIYFSGFGLLDLTSSYNLPIGGVTGLTAAMAAKASTNYVHAVTNGVATTNWVESYVADYTGDMVGSAQLAASTNGLPRGVTASGTSVASTNASGVVNIHTVGGGDVYQAQLVSSTNLLQQWTTNYVLGATNGFLTGITRAMVTNALTGTITNSTTGNAATATLADSAALATAAYMLRVTDTVVMEDFYSGDDLLTLEADGLHALTNFFGTKFTASDGFYGPVKPTDNAAWLKTAAADFTLSEYLWDGVNQRIKFYAPIVATVYGTGAYMSNTVAVALTNQLAWIESDAGHAAFDDGEITLGVEGDGVVKAVRYIGQQPTNSVVTGSGSVSVTPSWDGNGTQTYQVSVSTTAATFDIDDTHATASGQTITNVTWTIADGQMQKVRYEYLGVGPTPGSDRLWADVIAVITRSGSTVTINEQTDIANSGATIHMNVVVVDSSTLGLETTGQSGDWDWIVTGTIRSKTR